MGRRAVACGAVSRFSSSSAWMASPMPSLAQSAFATWTTPSPKLASRAMPAAPAASAAAGPPPPSPPRARPGGGRPAAPALRAGPDPRAQPLQGRPVEPVGAAEVVPHPGLDVALPGVAHVLGQGVVADHRAVLVPPSGGPQVHAHACSVPAAVRRGHTAPPCAHTFQPGYSPPPTEKPTRSRAARDLAGPNVPTDRKLRQGAGRGIADRTTGRTASVAWRAGPSKAGVRVPVAGDHVRRSTVSSAK